MTDNGTDKLGPLREELRRDLVGLLYGITSRIPGKADLDELIKSIVTGLMQLGFDRAGVWLLNEAGDKLCGTWGTDENGNLLDERNRELSLNSLPPLHGYTLRVDNPVLAKNLGVEVPTDIFIPKGQEKRFEEIWGSKPPYPGYYACTERGNNIVLPIVVSGKVIGAIGVDNFITGSQIEEEDAEILAMFTANMGIVVYNVRLLAELHKRTSFLESILDNANLWIAMTDNEGRITLFNSFAENLTGYNKDEVIGKSWFDVFTPVDKMEDFESIYKALKSSGQPSTYENAIHTKDGREVLMLWSNSVVKDAFGNVIGILSYGIDITQQRKLEKQLVQSEKMSDLGQLISSVAHELNNPLTAVIGYSQLLLGMDCDDKTKHTLATINSEAERCYKIVEGLLHFAREYEPRREYIQINNIVEATLNLKRYQLQVDNIQLELHISGDIPETLVDPHQMQQVFMNIINNAHQAMVKHSGRGKLTVETKLEDDNIVIKFTDTGPGIPEKNMSRIFEPFFTTKEPGKGTGLGLSICQTIIQDHGGSIFVDSELGKGATFTVCLPVMTKEPELIPVARPEEEDVIAASETGSRILVVDDEQRILDLFTDVLNIMGHKAFTARDGSQAMDRLDEGEYDLIICDLKMPGFGGEKLYNFIKVTNPELAKRIVFITGDTVNPETKSFLESTGNFYIGKPFGIEEIKQVLAKALPRKR